MKEYKAFIPEVISDSKGRNWFFDNKNKYICVLDFRTFHVTPIRKCPFLLIGFVQYMGCCIDDRLYITSYGKPQMLIFDCKTLEFINYSVIDDVSTQSWNAYLYDRTFYYVPRNLNGNFYKFDIQTKCITKTEFRVPMQAQNNAIGWGYQYLERIYIPETGENGVYKVDLKKQVVDKTTLDSDCHLYSMVWHNGKFYYTQTDNTSILMSGEDFGKLSSVGNQYELEEPFSKIISYKNKIIALPRFADYVAIINESGEYDRITLANYIRNEKRPLASASFGCYLEGKMILLLPWNIEEIIAVNIESMSCETYPMISYESDRYTNGILRTNEKDKNDLENYLWMLGEGMI